MLIPKENEKDLVEIPKNVKQGLDIRPVKWIDEVLEIALTRQPEPREDAEEAASTTTKSKTTRKRAAKKSSVTKH